MEGNLSVCTNAIPAPSNNIPSKTLKTAKAPDFLWRSDHELTLLINSLSLLTNNSIFPPYSSLFDTINYIRTTTEEQFQGKLSLIVIERSFIRLLLGKKVSMQK